MSTPPPPAAPPTLLPGPRAPGQALPQRPVSCVRSRAGSCARSRPHLRGFTLVELVVVMVLMAVIGALGMSRFAARDPFAVQGAADQLVSGLRLAHGMAVAQRQTLYVVLGASPATLQVCLDAACTEPLASPAGDLQWLTNAGGLQLSTAAGFSIQPSGVPSLASSLSLLMQNGDGSAVSQAVVVESGSGHVHSP